MKFYDKWYYAHMLGTLFARYLQKTLEKKDYPDLLIPVPLHRKRIRTRGFNQAVEIAKPIAKQLKITIDIKSCQRIKNTQPQTQLSAKARHTNVRNVFKVKSEIRAPYIAIIDDVVTTGNTVSEFAKALKKNGALRVDVWACARRH